jgi:hypothetical protein
MNEEWLGFTMPPFRAVAGSRRSSGEGTALAGIMRLVKEAQESKSYTQVLAEGRPAGCSMRHSPMPSARRASGLWSGSRRCRSIGTVVVAINAQLLRRTSLRG